MTTEYQRETLAALSDADLTAAYLRRVAAYRDSYRFERETARRAVEQCWDEVERRGLGPAVKAAVVEWKQSKNKQL